MSTQASSLEFCGVAVMAKASRAGMTKTRLCPPLTFEEAADLNTAFLKDTAETLAAAATETSLAGAMAFTPAGSAAFFRAILPRSIMLREVWYADFGDCLREAMRTQFSAGHRAACVLNSDSPTLPPALLIEMVEVLFRPGDRAVLGPSQDGGYYLLACKALHPRLFRGISWSTESVAAQTLQRAAEIGLPVHVLPEWYDVDDCASLKQLAGELLDGAGFSSYWRSGKAPHSTALLQSMVKSAHLRKRLDLFRGKSNPGMTLQEAAA